MIEKITSVNPIPLATAQIGQKLESSFWSEMLKASHAFEPEFDTAGSDQFTSFMIDAQAEQLSKTVSLGIGARITAILESRGDK